jgi:MFS transporter, DHA3 family, macrolide efflux protein
MWLAVSAAGAGAGLVAAAGTGARLAFGLLGGVYSDRWNRRRAMIASDLVRAALVATLAIAGARGPLELWHLAGVAAALGALDALFQPALQASLPALAPEPATLQRVNAALNVNARAALVVGPTLTGALLGVVPITQFFAVDGASFVASAAAIATLGRGYRWKGGASAGEGVRSMFAELADAGRVIRAHRWMGAALFSLVCSNVAWGAVVVGAPLLARDVLGGGPETYGYLMGGYGVGNVLSNVVLGVRPVRRRAAVFFAGGLVFSLGIAALGSARTLPAALVIMAVAAVGGPMQDLMLLSAVQRDVPPDKIGKVFAFRTTISQTGHGLGLVIVAPVLATLSIPFALAVLSLPGVAFSAVALFRLGRR